MNLMNLKLAVIGPKDDVLPYVSLGAAVCITGDAAEARKALLDFARQGHPVILVADDLLRAVRDTVEIIESQTPAAVSALPAKAGDESFSKSRTQAQVSRAIGFHLTGF